MARREGVADFGIGDHAVFRAGQKAEQGSIAAGCDGRAGGRPPPQRIPFWWLDFDDGGATVSKQLGAVRAGYSGG
jgi:hypothetical protein